MKDIEMIKAMDYNQQKTMKTYFATFSKLQQKCVPKRLNSKSITTRYKIFTLFRYTSKVNRSFYAFLNRGGLKQNESATLYQSRSFTNINKI